MARPTQAVPDNAGRRFDGQEWAARGRRVSFGWSELDGLRGEVIRRIAGALALVPGLGLPTDLPRLVQALGVLRIEDVPISALLTVPAALR